VNDGEESWPCGPERLRNHAGAPVAPSVGMTSPELAINDEACAIAEAVTGSKCSSGFCNVQ